MSLEIIITRKICILKDDNPFEIFWKENKNSLIYLGNDNQTYIKSRFYGNQRRNYVYEIMNIDKNLLDSLLALIPKIMIYANSLSNEPIELFCETIEKVKGIIINVLSFCEWE